jgi:hypothetical protein
VRSAIRSVGILHGTADQREEKVRLRGDGRRIRRNFDLIWSIRLNIPPEEK